MKKLAAAISIIIMTVSCNTTSDKQRVQDMIAEEIKKGLVNPESFQFEKIIYLDTIDYYEKVFDQMVDLCIKMDRVGEEIKRLEREVECECPGDHTQRQYGLTSVPEIKQLIEISRIGFASMKTESDSLETYAKSLEKKDRRTIKADFYYLTQDSEGKKLSAYRRVELNGNLQVKSIYSHKECDEAHTI
jgi:hypothetical protein